MSQDGQGVWSKGWRQGRGLVLVWLVLAGAGCATSGTYEAYHQRFVAGDYAAAKELVAVEEKGEAQKGKLLEYMLEGSADQMLGEVRAARECFTAADRVYEDVLKQEGALGASASQVGRTLAGDASGVYRGRFFEGTMAGTYKALAAWASGAGDHEVKTCLMQLSERQEAAKVHFAKQIAAAEAEAAQEERRSGENVGAAMGSPEMRKAEAALMDSAARFGKYANYDNPYAYYVSGLFRLVRARGDLSELALADQSFARAYGTGGDKGILWDKALVNGLAQRKVKGDILKNRMWVLVENGLCPVRQEQRKTLPLMLGGKLFTATLAWPELTRVPGGDGYGGFTLTGAGVKEGRAERVCSVETLAATEYRTELRGIWTRQAVSATAKILAQYAAQEAVRREMRERGQDPDGMVMLTGLLMGAVSVAITHADTRCWNSLPHEVLVARMEIPQDGKVELRTDEGEVLWRFRVERDSGPVVVWGRSAAAGRPTCVMVLDGKVEVVGE